MPKMFVAARPKWIESGFKATSSGLPLDSAIKTCASYLRPHRWMHHYVKQIIELEDEQNGVEST